MSAHRADTISVLGWALLAVIAFTSLTLNDGLVLGAILALLLPTECVARAVSTAIAADYGRHIERARGSRIAGALLKTLSAASAVSALAMLGSSRMAEVLFLEDGLPLVVASFIAGLRLLSLTIVALLRVAERHEASMTIASARALAALALALFLVQDGATVLDLVVAAAMAETLALVLGTWAVWQQHDPRGWDVAPSTTNVVNDLVRSTATWLPVAFVAAIVERDVAIDLVALTSTDIAAAAASIAVFVSLVAASLLVYRLAPPTGLMVASAVSFLAMVVLLRPTTPRLLWVSIGIVLVPAALSVRFRRYPEASPVDEVNGEMTIIATYSDPDLSMMTELSSLVTMASRNWERYEIIAVALQPDDDITVRVQGLRWDGLRHVSAVNGMRGDAVRRSISLATSNRIALIDLDLRVDHRAIPRYAALLDQFDLDAVVGSRRHRQSVVTQLRLRALVSLLFQWWCNATVDRRLSDSRSGLKLFRRSALLNVLPFSNAHGSGIDLELLGLIHRRRGVLADAPVNRPVHRPLPSAGESIAYLATAFWIGTRLRLQSGVS